MAEVPDKKARVQNYVKAVKFQNPDWIPCRVSLMPATWKKYREDLEGLVLRHPRLFPDHREGALDYDRVDRAHYRDGTLTDTWGCVWENVAEGLAGQVTHHPLERWDALEDYCPPDPLEVDVWGEPRDWKQAEREIREARKQGLLPSAGLYHGAMYMRLYYLRGFENFMVDMATGEPRLRTLIRMVLDYNMTLIRKYLELGAEWMNFADDLGTQRSLPMSPDSWRRYLKPCFAEMFGECRQAGAYVSMHSDGHMIEIIPDLVECGLNLVNPQIRANGLEELRRVAKGRVAIRLDLDRQMFPFATPEEIAEHIRTAARTLECKRGGLTLSAECEPDVPLRNIEAICSTLERIGGPTP